MKINIAYFTSTGNTLWLVKKAKRIFEENNHTVELFEVVKRGDEFFYNCDMIGIFYPVWSSTMPDPFRDVIISYSPDGNDKKIFLIGNCAQFTGDTEIYWKKVLVNKGYNVFYINHVIMPLNINIPGFNFWDIPEGKEKKKILKKANNKIETICDSVINFKKREEKISLYEKIGGLIQRNFYWIENIWKKKLTVDKNRCNQCGLCYRMCPTNNITLQENENITFEDDCILCLKCYNLCPQNAILIGEKSKDDKIYKRYKGPSEDIGPVIYR